jgi:hypothetical protein
MLKFDQSVIVIYKYTFVSFLDILIKRDGRADGQHMEEEIMDLINKATQPYGGNNQ